MMPRYNGGSLLFPYLRSLIGSSSVFSDLLPAADLHLEDVVLTPTTAVALLVSTSRTADCPRCGTLSDRIHSRYRRTVADLPCQDRPVALRLVVRKFRCPRLDCPQDIFCERLPGLLDAHARSTTRLTQAHRAVGFALGGEAGARLAGRLDMPTSPDTLLRRVKAAPDEPAPPPRYIGIDDWAIRKGHRYGTILIDLERGRVLDLLPGRDGESLKAWLREHPGVEVVTRDRWAAFAQAVAEAAPQARQVADRFHLLKNLREAVERLLGRLSEAVHEALREAPGMPADPAETPAVTAKPSVATDQDGGADAWNKPLSPREQAQQERRRRRTERYQRVRELRDQGLSMRRIAGEVGLEEKTIRRYLRLNRCPDWNPGRRSGTRRNDLTALIDAWISGGGRNVAQLHRDLTAGGCHACYETVRRHVARRLGSTGHRDVPRKPSAPPVPSARQLSFDCIRQPQDRDVDEQRRVDRLRAADAMLREGLDLAAEFAALVRKAGKMSLADWLATAERSACRELRSFAAGLRQDEAAVSAGLREAWSNGPVEGQVNRLKTIKRQMYGRAGFSLLRARVLRAA
jgi:transposase